MKFPANKRPTKKEQEKFVKNFWSTDNIPQELKVSTLTSGCKELDFELDVLYPERTHGKN